MNRVAVIMPEVISCDVRLRKISLRMLELSVGQVRRKELEASDFKEIICGSMLLII